MEKPDINDKKYKYFHKKAGKIFFNNTLYLSDCQLYAKLEDLKKK